MTSSSNADQSYRHPIGLLTLMTPGLGLISFAVLVDVVRGKQMIADWGTGQSILLLVGMFFCFCGFLMHRKAILTERQGGRRYQRTLAFIVAPVILFVAVPLVLGELVSRWLPEPDNMNASYRQVDPKLGFSVIPNRKYHVVSRPRNLDLRVQIGENRFRTGPDGQTVDVAQADVVVIGDSHVFGIGVEDDQTLPYQVERSLQQNGFDASVLNAGNPGYGIGQTLLMLRSFERLRRGAVVVVFVNPVNDLVNLSSAVDYYYPKPNAALRSGKLVFNDAPKNWGEGPFLFSEPFDSLNDYFKLGDQRRFYHSMLLRRLLHTAGTPETIDGVVQLTDDTDPDLFHQNESESIQNAPLLYASRFWPEMPKFEGERETLLKLTQAVFQEMFQLADASGWEMLVVVAPEAHEHQQYSQHFLAQVQELMPDIEMEFGWSRQAVLTAVAGAKRTAIVPNYVDSAGTDADLESFFVTNDSHTSEKGHAVTTSLVIKHIVEQGWLESCKPDPSSR